MCRVGVWVKARKIKIIEDQNFSVVEVIPVLLRVVGTLHLNKMFNLDNTHQKSNFQTLFSYSEKQNN